MTHALVTPVVVTPLLNVRPMCGVTSAYALLYACMVNVHIGTVHAANSLTPMNVCIHFFVISIARFTPTVSNIAT